MPYTPGRGGLLTLINNKYAFSGNIAKIPTPANISPYLQIIHINNQPLKPWLHYKGIGGFYDRNLIEFC
jgi:hypothetical protein